MNGGGKYTLLCKGLGPGAKRRVRKRRKRRPLLTYFQNLKDQDLAVSLQAL